MSHFFNNHQNNLLSEKNKTTFPWSYFLSNFFFDFGSFSDSAAQIVKFCASDFTGTHDVNFDYVRRVNRESFFHADTVRQSSDGKGLGDSAAVLRDYRTLEKLYSFLFALFNTVVNANGVTDVEYRYGLLQLLICQNLNEIHFLALLTTDIRA